MLQVGDVMPDFELKDQNGKPFNSKEIKGKKPCVLFFYPKDFTPGCTAESCGFRDRYEAFEERGVKVIGISSDSVKSHHKFAKFYRLPFLLLADSEQKVQRKFGVKSHFFGLLTQRITFVFNQEGKLVKVYKSHLAKGHIEASLNAVKLF